MNSPSIELVYFSGCPNAEQARRNLRAALEAAGRTASWTEWDQLSAATPERVSKFGSPTVLIGGRDVTGVGAASAAACRADGAPSVAAIRAALTASA